MTAWARAAQKSPNTARTSFALCWVTIRTPPLTGSTIIRCRAIVTVVAWLTLAQPTFGDAVVPPGFPAGGDAAGVLAATAVPHPASAAHSSPAAASRRPRRWFITPLGRAQDVISSI